MVRPIGTTRLLTTLLSLVLLSTPAFAQFSARSAAERLETADSSLVVFSDDFAGKTLDAAHWQPAAGIEIVRDPTDRHRNALRLATPRKAAKASRAQPTVLTSTPIDLHDIPGAEVTYSLLPYGVNVGESLLVEYCTQDEHWMMLERVVASPGAGSKYSARRHILPADALHAKLRIRFSATVSDPDAGWYLREFSVVRRRPQCELALRSYPREGVLCTIVSNDLDEIRPEATPARRTYACGTNVVVAAPATQDGWVFDAWTIEGQSSRMRQRMLSLELTRDTTLTARYRPWGGSRNVAKVTVVSLPDEGIPVDVTIDQVGLPPETETDADLEVLTGELLQLIVPERTPHWVFETWVVDGATFYTPGPILELRITGDTVILAEYALLGDMNADGRLDKFDVDAFVTALIDSEGYALQFPGVQRVQRGDVNGDGLLDALDVEQFVDLMVEE